MQLHCITYKVQLVFQIPFCTLARLKILKKILQLLGLYVQLGGPLGESRSSGPKDQTVVLPSQWRQ